MEKLVEKLPKMSFALIVALQALGPDFCRRANAADQRDTNLHLTLAMPSEFAPIASDPAKFMAQAEVPGITQLAKKALVTLGGADLKRILSKDEISHHVTHRGALERIGDAANHISVLYVSGTPYEMGYEHGRLLKSAIQEVYRNVDKGLSAILPSNALSRLPKSMSVPIAHLMLDMAYDKMAPYIPQDKREEMQGLADGSGLPVEAVHRLHAIPDLSQTSCSALFATKQATRDGHTYQLRILDYDDPFRLHDHPLIIVYRPDRGNGYLNIGWAGFIGIVSGINEKKVAVSEVGFGGIPGQTLGGEPMPFVLEDVLRFSDTAEGAATIIRRDPGTNSYIYLFGDSSGHGIGMHVTKQRIVEVAVNQVQTISLVGPSYPKADAFPQLHDMLHAGQYEEKMTELLRQMSGRIDEPAIEDLARQIAMPSNLHTVIYDLTEGEIWVANRSLDQRAADRKFVPFSLTEAFSKH